MKRVMVALLTGALVLAPSAQAWADFEVPPDPEPAGSSSSDNTNHGGNKYKFGTAAWVRLGASIGGHIILRVGGAKRSDHMLWGIGSALAGPVGGAGALALFQENDGLITNLVKGTFKCQPNDKRDRCAIWVQQHQKGPAFVRTSSAKSKAKFVRAKRHMSTAKLKLVRR